MLAVGAAAVDVVETFAFATLKMMAIIALPGASVLIVERAVIAPIAVIERAIIAVIVTVVIVGRGDVHADADTHAADIDTDADLSVRGCRAEQRRDKNRSDKNFHKSSLSIDCEFRLTRRIQHR